MPGTKNKMSLLKGKKSREGTHGVILDHEAVEQYAQARGVLTLATDNLRLARRRSEPDVTLNELQAIVDEAQSRVDELEPAAQDGVVEVKLRAMPPLEYAALKAMYPPNDGDHKRVQVAMDDKTAKAAWNSDEFAPRLVARCVIDPAVTLDEAREYQAAWGEPDWNQLVNACKRLHEQAVDSSLVFSSGRTRS